MTASTASAKAMSVAVGTAQPSREPPPVDVDQRVDERGHGHAAQRGDHGQRGGLGVAQLPGDQLALELDAGDEEEDGEQPVGRPVLDGQVEAERGGAEVEVADGLVAVAERGVRPDQRGDRGDQQQDAADGLGAQRVRDEVPLGQRTGGRGTCGWCGAGAATGRTSGRVRQDA